MQHRAKAFCYRPGGGWSGEKDALSTPCTVWCNGSLTRVLSSPRGHVVMSGGSLGCHHWGSDTALF